MSDAILLLLVVGLYGLAAYAIVKNNQQERKLMATQAEAAALLKQANDSLAKIGAETSALLQKVTDLQTAAAKADQVSPELQAAIDGVVSQAKSVDDLVPDVATT